MPRHTNSCLLVASSHSRIFFLCKTLGASAPSLGAEVAALRYCMAVLFQPTRSCCSIRASLNSKAV
eukprot:2115001-Lingulodinium_polyedra.AAC.1